MILVYNILTFLFTTIIAFRSLIRLLNNNYGALHLCLLVYYIMQCLPILFELIFTSDSLKYISPIFYNAMIDDTVSLIYDSFLIVTSIILYFVANRNINNMNLLNLKFSKLPIKSNILNILTFAMMFLPIIVAIVFSPNPNIYLEYAYFYRIDKGPDSLDRIYYYEVANKLLYISFFFAIVRYYLKKKNSIFSCIDIYFCIFIITWVSQKRTMMVFLLLSILIIDFIKKNYISFKFYLNKCLLFLVIIVGYFIYYSENVKKVGEDIFLQYTLYFSRLNVEKVAIYDILHDDRILEYRGESVLYNFLSFIPRYLWPNKPGMYTKNFTAYVETGYGSNSFWIPYNLQVNIWGDWVSSFGLTGHFMALFFLIYVVLKSEKSNNYFTFLLGLIFSLSYLMFGFEGIVMWSFWVWVIMRLYIKSKSLKIY